tara:strand:+ start:2251 stop:2862 length:612 start_codon:yes stop_codon:yes gene_type:complete
MAKLPSTKTKPPRVRATSTTKRRKTPLSSQITDRNFLTPTGFLFQVQRAPKISYFGNRINVPSLNLGVAQQTNYLTDIPRPGEKIDFGDLSLRFLIDENLENYLEVQNWIRGIGFPESLTQIYDFQKTGNIDGDNDMLNLYSDGTLTILSQLNKPMFYVKFEDLFPYQLSDIQFDATVADVEYLTAEVSFKYTIYNIEPTTCC